MGQMSSHELIAMWEKHIVCPAMLLYKVCNWNMLPMLWAGNPAFPLPCALFQRVPMDHDAHSVGVSVQILVSHVGHGAGPKAT